MALIYEPLEIADSSGRPTRRYRYTCRSDESSIKDIWPLCDCEGGHISIEAARACPIVAAELARAFGESNDV
jgi:hypothetical protein